MTDCQNFKIWNTNVACHYSSDAEMVSFIIRIFTWSSIICAGLTRRLSTRNEAEIEMASTMAVAIRCMAIVPRPEKVAVTKELIGSSARTCKRYTENECEAMEDRTVFGLALRVT